VVEKDGHIQQQSFFISPPLNPTFLLRQENLEGDLNVFLGKNRFPLVTVRRINTTDPDEHSLYLNKLLTDSDLMSKVMAVYEQDIHLFQSLSVEKNKTI